MYESTFTQSGAAVVRADGDLVVQEAGALAMVAGGDATITQGGAAFMAVGGNVAMEQAGAMYLFVGGSVELSEARVGQMVALEASVTDGKVGVLIGGKVSLEHSQVMVGTAQAAAAGVAVGGVLFLLSRLFRRR